MCALFIFISGLLISVSSYGMINEDITIYTLHEILKEEIVPNVLGRKLGLEGDILTSFHKGDHTTSDADNMARKTILTAVREGVDNLKAMITLSQTSKKFYQSLSSLMVKQEIYIFDTLEYISIYKDIGCLVNDMDSLEGTTGWRKALTQLRLYTTHKDILQFLTYFSIKRKLNGDIYNNKVPDCERLLSYLLRAYTIENAPYIACGFQDIQLVSKLLYRSLCKEKQRIVSEIAEHIVKGIFCAKSCIEIVSVLKHDPFILNNYLIILDKITDTNDYDSSKLYILIKTEAM